IHSDLGRTDRFRAPRRYKTRSCFHDRRCVVILGMSTSTFTAVHVVLSLIGIFSGLIVLFGMFSANRLTDWTALFLVSTVLTSVTGFLFHSAHIRPSHVVGVISLVVLAVAFLAAYDVWVPGALRRVLLEADGLVGYLYI